jgi:hypothetical protein
MHQWGVRKGLIPMFNLISHVQAQWLTLEKLFIFESKPFLNHRLLGQNWLTLEKWLALISQLFSKEQSNINRNQNSTREFINTLILESKTFLEETTYSL